MSSVYLWDLDHGFAGVILIKKAGDGSNKIKGCWDSIHVVEVQVCLLTFMSYCVYSVHRCTVTALVLHYSHFYHTVSWVTLRVFGCKMYL